MWNPVPFYKRYCQRGGLSRRASGRATAPISLAFAALALWISGGWTAGLAGAPDLPLPGVSAPELARLFTPQHVPAGTYQVTVVQEGIEAALGVLRQTLPPGFRLGTPPGAWQAQKLDPLDAFGRAGTYDRARMAQLYLGKKVSVARGPIELDGRAVGAVTLFSPYPDPTLTRLEPGTLLIGMRTGP